MWVLRPVQINKILQGGIKTERMLCLRPLGSSGVPVLLEVIYFLCRGCPFLPIFLHFKRNFWPLVPWEEKNRTLWLPLSLISLSVFSFFFKTCPLLRRILLNYAVYNPAIGYSQGMSDLVAPILAEVLDESDTFWCFVGLMQNTIFISSPRDEDMEKQLVRLGAEGLLRFPSLPCHSPRNPKHGIYTWGCQRPCVPHPEKRKGVRSSVRKAETGKLCAQEALAMQKYPLPGSS